MITVTEARQLIESHSEKLSPVAVSLLDGAGCILAEDIRSGIDLPRFEQAAMDGYALNAEQIPADQSMEMEFEVSAGDTNDWKLSKGKCARIFTGALLPKGADTIVMQEHVTREGKLIQLTRKDLKANENIRQRGSEIKAGEIALKEGTLLTPGAIGFLASLGVQEISVYLPPRIGIITSGNELQFPGEELKPGQVYNSNSFMLCAALHEGRMEASFFRHCTDDPELMNEAISEALEQCDILLISGGMASGDHDLVRAALDKNNVREIFYKVNQRPGKVLYFGRKQETLVFGLPGNPAASLTCFYEYVMPCIRQMSGMKALKKERKFLQGEHPALKNGLSYFLKAKLEGDKVFLLNNQESFKLRSFGEANCLVELNGDQNYKDGDKVSITRFDKSWC